MSLLGALAEEYKAKVRPEPTRPGELPPWKPAEWIRDHVRFPWGKQPTDYQIESLEVLPRVKRYALRGPHGLGKTALAAWTVLAFAAHHDGRPGHDWKVLTTAGSWRQLTHYLWPEIHKWAPLVDWRGAGAPQLADLDKRLMTMEFHGTTGAAKAIASNKSGTMEGGHADHGLLILDEAKLIPGGTFDTLEGITSIGTWYVLVISTPGNSSGRFYNICRRAAGFEDWTARHVTMAEVIAAGRMERSWAEQRARQWGEDSAIYKQRVLGEFADDAPDALIPLAWVEAAQRRWLDLRDDGTLDGLRLVDLEQIGADIARDGTDSEVEALRFGRVISALVVTRKPQLMQAVARLEDQCGGRRDVPLVIDATGLGAGVYERCAEKGLRARGFIAGASTSLRDRAGLWGFVNCRSAMWWNIREWLNPENLEDLCLPDDDNLTEELTEPRWRRRSDSKIEVEPKRLTQGWASAELQESREDERKSLIARLKRSPDRAEAVGMALWEGEAEQALDDAEVF